MLKICPVQLGSLRALKSLIRNRKHPSIDNAHFLYVSDRCKMAEEQPQSAEILSNNLKEFQKTEEEKPDGNTDVLNKILELLQKKNKGEPKDYIAHNPFPKQREDPVVVYVRISINKIGDIDTVRQEFQCEFYMRLRWTEEKLKAIGEDEKEQTTWDSIWDPRYHFLNAVRIDKEDVKKKFLKGGEVVYHCYITGVFKEVLKLDNFPFDYQKLSMTLSAKCDAKKVELKGDPAKEDNIRTDNFYAPQEWKLCSHVLTESNETKKKEGASENHYPQHEIRMNVRRKYEFYIYNAFLVIFLITALTFASFTVEADLPGDRVQISLTLLLTSVAFKYYVQQFVPTVSYFTLIDRYILSCMVFQFFMTVHNMVGGLIKNHTALRIFEWTSFGVAVFAFMLINAYFGYLSWMCIKKARKSEAEDEKKYKEACTQRKSPKKENNGQKKNAGDPVPLQEHALAGTATGP